MKVRGRIWLGLWLLVFLVVSVTVVGRQRAALTVARELATLREERLALEARMAEYQRRIREAESRPVLVPLAERRLGLRLPESRENVIFPLQRAPEGRR